MFLEHLYFIYVFVLFYPLQDTSVVVAPSGFSPYIPSYRSRNVDEIEMRSFSLANRVEEISVICSKLCGSDEDQGKQISDLQVFASSAESDVRGLQTSVSSISSELSTLQTSCSSNEACLKALFEAQAAQLDDIQASVDQIGGAIKKLETKFVCEGQFEILSRRLDNLEGCRKEE